MPSSITHALIAEEAAKRLPEQLQTLISEAPEAYFLGAQGPDMFFFAKKTNKQEGNFGKYLHRNAVYELFCAFAKALPTLSGQERTVAEAYCLGYVTHYCADVAFHPFVYRYLEQNALKKREHQRMENDWDVYFARKLRGREAEHYPFPDVKACKNNALLALWRSASGALGRTPMDEKTLYGGIDNFAWYLAFFHKKCYTSQKHWRRFDRLFHIRALSCLYPAKEPDRRILSGEAFERAANADPALPPVASADDLFERAVSESAYKMLLFRDAVGGAVLPEEQFDRHLLTGKHMKAQQPSQDRK